MISMHATNKPFNIDKRLVYEAYKAVKSNRGAAGVDEQTIEQFEADLAGNLYKIWNRMSSGSYFPTPVRPSPFPKRVADQSSPPGMDCVLWALCPLGAVSRAAIRQPDAHGMGAA
jgi:hypothetical protein